VVVVNVVGVGHWGPNLVRNFCTHPDARVGTVCDLSTERLRLIQRNNPGVANLSTDSAATVKDPAAGAVVIATPVATHYRLARAALEAGKHVLVEKPMCSTVEEAEQLVGLAREVERHLCVGHVFLFNAGIRFIREMILRGDLGRVFYCACTRTNLGPFRSDANALWDLASHDISILNYWFAAAPLAVSATGRSYLNPHVEDVVTASFSYPDGIAAYVNASWLNPRKVREIIVVGETGMVVWNDMDLVEPIRIYHKSVDIQREQEYSDSFGSFRMSIRNGNVVIPPIAGAEPLAAECAHFVDCVLGRAEPLNSGAGSLGVMRALDAADRSMRQHGAMVQLTPPCLLEDATAPTSNRATPAAAVAVGRGTTPAP
jgi:predicted dehydrogenase